MRRAQGAKIVVLLDPELRRKAAAAARREDRSLSSWTLGLVTRELEIDWEPPPRGRPAGAKNLKPKKKRKKKRKKKLE